jgi:hypothetical protein
MELLVSWRSQLPNTGGVYTHAAGLQRRETHPPRSIAGQLTSLTGTQSAAPYYTLLSDIDAMGKHFPAR